VNGLLKTLVKPDWDDNPKRSEILHAANLLQIGEFQLIQLAYKVWYKENLPEKKINNIFSEYMITEIIPIWVTYYARDIIKMEHANVLNSYDEKYHVYDHEFGEYIHDSKQRKKRGIFYAMIIAIVFIGSHYMAANYIEEPAGLFPPYVEKKIAFPELYEKKK
jgi:hypothetical protein|tara:strand:- start:50 stop:538 length:489 start_codon:yes stop_codon:yes gene_type:complete